MRIGVRGSSWFSTSLTPALEFGLNAQLQMSQIEVQDGGVTVQELVIPSADVAGFLERVQETERASKLIDAVEVGVACLERATATLNFDFVRQQCEQQLRLLSGEVSKIPGKVQEELLKRVGTGDGQVLSPIVAVIGATERSVKDRLAELQRVFSSQFDPSRTDSTLGRALGIVQSMLNPKHDGSVQKTIEGAVQAVAGNDGAIAQVVRSVLEREIKPLREEVDRLAKELRGQQSVEVALAVTTAKGPKFELELLPTLQCWSKITGFSVSHVGGDQDPGDIVLTAAAGTVAPDNFRIVIQARDEKTARGRKYVNDRVEQAMARREAHFGLYITKTPEGLAKEIGEWSEGACSRGPYVVCASSYLTLALRWAILVVRLEAAKACRPEVDSAAIETGVQRVRTALVRLRTIKTKSTEIRTAADSVSTEADHLRTEINDALAAIEDAVRHRAAEAA